MLRTRDLLLVACVLVLTVGLALTGCSRKPAEPAGKTAPAGEKGEPGEAAEAPETSMEEAPEGEPETEPVPAKEAEVVKEVVAADTEWKEATPAAAPAPEPAKTMRPGRPDPATVTKCAAAPTIDGKLDDACWKDAGLRGVWVDVYTGMPAKPQSRAFITYDAKNVYVAFLNPEANMKDLVADTTTRDGQTWNDDSNELFIDPTAGRKDYFQFIVNTAEVLYDGQGRDGGFDSKCVAKVHKGEAAWSLEMAIPLSELGVKGSPAGQTWTANFCRNRQTQGQAEASAWSDTGESFHNPEAFGKLKMK
jgi:hypothetical protein